MSKLVYYSKKIPIVVPVFMIIFVVVGAISVYTEMMISGGLLENVSLFLLLLFTVLAMITLPIWIIYRASYSKNIAIYEDHVEIEGKGYSWQDIVEIKQPFSVYFVEMRFKNNGNVDLAILRNEHTRQELFIRYGETELVKRIKEIHSRNRKPKN